MKREEVEEDAEGQRRFARAGPASGPLKRDTRRSLSVERPIVVFRSVAIQNTWSILAGATNNGRLEWVCLAEEGPRERDG